MKLRILSLAAALLSFPLAGQEAQAPAPESVPTDTSRLVLSLEDALKIALSENTAVKVADKEVERARYAKKGTYAALFPSVDLSGSYQRTIKKQVMYMDGMSIGGMFTPLFQAIQSATGMDMSPYIEAMEGSSSSSSDGGISIGRWNTWNAGLTAAMPLINVQLWKSLKLSGQDVELAIEKARSSRLETVTQVKQAFYAVLMAKEAFKVYRSVYENAVENFSRTEKRYNAQHASELDFVRAKTNVANAIPNVNNAESAVILALWQLKAVMGVDLDRNVDVAGALSDYSGQMFYDIHSHDNASLEGNAALRQLALQAEELASAVKIQQYAYLPTLSAAFSYSMMAMENNFKFSEYHWTPYSYAALSLNIPIFSGGKRLNQVRQAKAQQEELELQRVNTERQLKIAIRQSLNTMETQMKTYIAAQDALESARKAYDIAQKAYDVGRGTLTDLNDAQLGLTQVELGVHQAVYSFLVAKSALEQTLGRDFIDQDGNADLQGSYGKTETK